MQKTSSLIGLSVPKTDRFGKLNHILIAPGRESGFDFGHVEAPLVSQILAAGFGLDGVDLLGVERFAFLRTFVAFHRTLPALAVSPPAGDVRSRHPRIASQMRAPDRVCRAGAAPPPGREPPGDRARGTGVRPGSPCCWSCFMPPLTNSTSNSFRPGLRSFRMCSLTPPAVRWACSHFGCSAAGENIGDRHLRMREPAGLMAWET